MEIIHVSNSVWRKVEKLRPEGATPNRVIAALLAATKLTRKDVEDFEI